MIETKQSAPMGDKFDSHIPNTSTAWQLWHSDTFDRENMPSLQAGGVDIIQGLYQLWLFTLKEGILDNGSASFSRFHLTSGNTPFTRVDVAVDPFNNRALLKLRQWTTSTSPHQDVNDKQRETILRRLAQLHYERLQESDRWKSSTISWSAEAGQLLVHVESVSDPGEI